MKQTLKIIPASALVTVVLLKAAPLLAEPALQNVSVVHTTDLDLSTVAGRNALDHRLVVAAYDVCGPASDSDLSGQNKARACRADVLAKARSDGAQLASKAGSIRVAAAN